MRRGSGSGREPGRRSGYARPRSGRRRKERRLTVLLDAAEDVVDVVGEEALLVEDGGEALGAGVDGHGLSVAVAVHLANGVEALLEGLAVGGEADDGEQDSGIVLGGVGAADLEDLGGEPRVDAVAGGQTGVAGHDGEVGAGNSEGRAAVIRVSARRHTHTHIMLLHFSFSFRDRGNARVKSVFPQAIYCVFGNVGEGVVGPVQDGVLAEHGHLGLLQ